MTEHKSCVGKYTMVNNKAINTLKNFKAYLKHVRPRLTKRQVKAAVKRWKEIYES